MRYPEAWQRGQSLGERIGSELRLRILEGELPAGETISENKVAAEFGTSRSPVRDALKTLANEGLIRLERMGAVVVGMGAQEVEELYDVRCLIESFAQRRLADRFDDRLAEQLGRIIDRLELAARHRDPVEFACQDMAFHETIVAAANHSRIWQLWRSIRQIVLAVMLITTREVFSEGGARVAGVVDKHRALLTGLRSGRPDEIEATVRAYFADSYATLHKSIPRP